MDPIDGSAPAEPAAPARRIPTGPIAPMLAAPGDETAFRESGSWIFELKWDGIRAVARIQGDEVTLRSRNGLDLTPSYPELSLLREAFEGDGVLDGEIVALDAAGRPSFARLQRRMNLTVPRDVERARIAVAVHYFAFDLIELDGRSLVKEPYEKRRELLRGHLRDGGRHRDAAGRRDGSRGSTEDQRGPRARGRDGQAIRQSIPDRPTLA